MKKTILWIAGALVVLVVAGGAAWAQMFPGGGPGMHGRGFRMMKHMISARIEDAEDLIQATPQQRAVIDQAKQDVFKALEARAQQKQANAPQVIALLTAPNLDTDALYKLADQHAQDVKEMANVIIPELKKVHDVLTPAQLQTLAQHAKQMHARRQGPPPPQE